MRITEWLSTTMAPLVAVALLSLAPAALADEPGEEAMAESAAEELAQGQAATRRAVRGQIEEITVTARKREENLQQTPISITAFGVQTLEDNTVTRMDDISDLTPNMQYDTGSLGLHGFVSIRGIGNGDAIATRDPAVGIYVDGIYIARSAGHLLAVSDPERIEVLRGPQGTLFGRNTVGGAVNVITAKPDDEFSARGTLRYGNYNNIETRAHVNIPLNDDWAFMRLSFASQTRDPVKDNKARASQLAPGQGGLFPKFKDLDDRKLLAGRVSLRLLPTENLELTITGDQARVHQRARGAHCNYDENSEAGAGRTASGAFFPSLTIGSLIGPADFPPVGLPPDGGMNLWADYRANCERTEDLDYDEFTSNVPGKVTLDTWGVSFTTTWDATEDITLKYIGAWRRSEHGEEQEFDWTGTAEFGHCDRDEEQADQVSHELNANGLALDGRLSWTAGLYTFREKTNPRTGYLCRVAQTYAQQLFSIGFPTVPLFGGFLPPGAAVPPGVFTPVSFSFVELNWVTNNTYAGYAQATYDLTEQLSVTAGVRRMNETKKWKHIRQRPTFDLMRPSLGALCPPGVPGTFVVACTLQDVTDDERFDKWTFTGNIQYQWNDDLMTYVTYSTGYKSGGFNGRADSPTTIEGFDPEKVDSYEFGMKSAWFDNRVTANLAAFLTEYEDIQQTVLKSEADGSFSSVVRNAGEAQIRGVELEVNARPLPGLDASIGLGLIDADYHEKITFNNDGERVNRRDDDFANTPDVTLNVSLAYSVETPFGVLTPRVSYYHQDEVNFDEDTDKLTQGTYGLLNGRISLVIDDRTEVALWGRNLTDRKYKNTGIPFFDGFAVGDVFYGDPVRYGIEVSRRF